ncbi:MAG: hypothetical protein LBV27_10125 [Oscillospiraceae bacterium]|jgi:hypothetical protein|nr:hypothetical protein [Oscillospiraceae bacterium]
MKKIRTAVLIVLVLLCAAGCDSALHNAIYDDDKAIAGVDSVVVLTSIGTCLDEGSYEITIASQTGAQTVWRCDADSDTGTVNLSCRMTVSDGGKAKIVLIDPDNVVTTLLEAAAGDDEQLTEYTFDAEKGRYRIKIVAADGAAIKAGIDFDKGTWGK